MTDTVIIEFFCDPEKFMPEYMKIMHELPEALDATNLTLYEPHQLHEPAYLAVYFGSIASMQTFKTTWTRLFNEADLFKHMVAAKILPGLPEDARFRTVLDDGSD